MRTEDYTPDAICRSLGIGAFDEPFKHGKPVEQLRLLLCPSFAPELSITLFKVVAAPDRARGRSSADKKTILSVAASRTQIWTMAAPGLVTVDHVKSEMSSVTLKDLEMKFRSALAAPPLSTVMLDGMPVSAVWRRFGSSILVEDTPAKDSPFGNFVAEVVNLAFEVSDNISCRNALARAGCYVGLDLPMEAVTESRPKTQVSVLGVPDDQNELLAALAAVAGRQTRL